jgi:hypothetical protein
MSGLPYSSELNESTARWVWPRRDKIMAHGLTYREWFEKCHKINFDEYVEELTQKAIERGKNESTKNTTGRHAKLRTSTRRDATGNG